MRWVAIVIAICGCNQIFDLRATTLDEIRVTAVDAPADATRTCPAFGTLPRFSSQLTQAVAQRCRRYSVASGPRIAVALCRDTYEYIYEGRVDDGMSRAHGDLATITPYTFALAPEGNEMYVAFYEDSYVVARFVRGADGGWMRRESQTIAYFASQVLSSPTWGPNRRMMHLESNMLLTELAGSGTGTWSKVGMYTPADLGVGNLFGMTLSPDGLRLVFFAYLPAAMENLVFYAERPDLASRFGPGRLLETVPPVADAFVTDDCSRVYFSGLSSVFYANAL